MGRKPVIAGAAIFALAFVGGAAFAANRFVITNIGQIKPNGSTAVAPAGPGIGADTGQIAFISLISGPTAPPVFRLELVHPDGSDLRPVGHAECFVGHDCFAWSPNGKQLAYLAGPRRFHNPSFHSTLYLVGAEGQHPRELTVCGYCEGVSWSPDGSQIAVGRYGAGQVNVWVVSAKTGAMRRITDCQPTSTCGAAGFVFAFQMEWSPDGRTIFFIRDSDHQGSIADALFTVRPDGSDLTELKVPDPGIAYWSPDGRELAVNAANGVYIVDAAGTVRELTKLRGAGGIAWSPDSRDLAIAAAGGIYTINADGKRLTHLADRASGPAWSPNGKQLAYDGSVPKGVHGIWTINADGSGRRLIYKTRATVPMWSPNGSQLAFSSKEGTYVVNANGNDLHRIGQPSFGALAWQPMPSTG